MDGKPLQVPDADLRAAASRWKVPDLDLRLLRQALLHSSAAPARSPTSNERLEFLGDSILNASVAEALYLQYPDWNEGDLAKGRSLVVSKVSLYGASIRLGLPELVVVGANTQGTLARSRRSLAADCLEALYAAIYLQFGWLAAREFVLSSLAPEMSGLEVRKDLRDPKTILQEQAQEQRVAPPVYLIIAEEGDPHSRVYTAEVRLHDGSTATGRGRSKKDAQQDAASTLLNQAPLSLPTEL